MVKSHAVYMDLETGGLRDDSPDIQLAAIAVDETTGAELATFQRKLQFNEALADRTALELNHYDPAVWDREAAPPSQVVREFSTFITPFRCLEMWAKSGGRYHVAKLVGHNSATFDGPRLFRLFKAHGAFLAADPRVRCTVQRALFWFDERPTLKPPENFRLTTLCEYFAIPTDGAHDALADVRMTIALARALRADRAEAAA